MNREIAPKFNTGWEVGTVKGVEKSGEFAVFYESDKQLWKQDQTKHHHVFDKYWVLPENKHLTSDKLHTRFASIIKFQVEQQVEQHERDMIVTNCDP